VVPRDTPGSNRRLSITAIVIVLVVSVLSSLRMHPGEEVWPDGRVP
jgi:hypothetical protein